MGPHLKALTDSGLATPFAFADDVMMVAAPQQALAALELWETLLRPSGLALTPHKLAIWDRQSNAEVSRLIRQVYPQASVSSEGVTLCGLPLEGPADDSDLVWGTPSYVDRFLADVVAQLDVRLGALSRFMHVLGPASVAAHVSLHVLRINLLPRFVHLFRLLLVDWSLQLARQIDLHLLPWLQEQI